MKRRLIHDRLVKRYQFQSAHASDGHYRAALPYYPYYYYRDDDDFDGYCHYYYCYHQQQPLCAVSLTYTFIDVASNTYESLTYTLNTFLILMYHNNIKRQMDTWVVLRRNTLYSKLVQRAAMRTEATVALRTA